MSAKKLDQSVFEGLPSEYRWAVTDFCGEVFALSGEKPELNAQKNDWHFCGKDYLLIPCKYGDATDWQNSLIERQDVPTAADIDWSRQDVPEGATHYNTRLKQWFVAYSNGRIMGFDGEWWRIVQGYTLADLEGGSEIVKRPYPELNWADAPSEATHAAKFQDRWGFVSKHDIIGWMVWGGEDWFAMKLAAGEEEKLIKRPESITDVARSIEAARVAEQFKVEPCPYGCVAATIEQSERTYPHYFKDVSDVDAIDLYHVARLYDITDPALFHAFKKIACAGKRGAKDQAQDVQEAIDALKRWQELNV